MSSSRAPDYHPDDLMTAAQWITFAIETYAQQDESLGEHETQYLSECALFGDAGPGQALAVRQMKAELAQMRATFLRLTGRDLRACAKHCWGDEGTAMDAPQDQWVPACGGTETPFNTRNGHRLQYLWNKATGEHAYIDCNTDIILTTDEAIAALGTL